MCVFPNMSIWAPNDVATDVHPASSDIPDVPHSPTPRSGPAKKPLLALPLAAIRVSPFELSAIYFGEKQA